MPVNKLSNWLTDDWFTVTTNAQSVTFMMAMKNRTAQKKQ